MKGYDKMTNQQIIHKVIENSCKKRIKQLEQNAITIIDKGTERAVKTAIKDINVIHRQYIYKYYKSYRPREYKITNNLWDITIGGRYKKNGKVTGDILIVYSNKNVTYPNPKTNADMVF